MVSFTWTRSEASIRIGVILSHLFGADSASPPRRLADTEEGRKIDHRFFNCQRPTGMRIGSVETWQLGSRGSSDAPLDALNAAPASASRPMTRLALAAQKASLIRYCWGGCRSGGSAVANAIFRETGTRIRTTPFRKADLRTNTL